MAPQNPLPIHGNDKTMNLNSLILTNIQSSPYFKVNLYELKTYHEVIDEIYYKVDHLEPWEKGSRKTAGQTGMCGGVRGVGAGGIVSSAFCLLYKLFTLRLTHKQVVGLCTHNDSPFIRGLGFMYIRYTQHPSKLWDWYHEYLADEEEIDVKAGGGHPMTIGEMLRQWLVKLEWYSTLFPRIPVSVQKENEIKLREFERNLGKDNSTTTSTTDNRKAGRENSAEEDVYFGEAERISRMKQSASPIRCSRSPAYRKRSPHSQNNRASPHRSVSYDKDKLHEKKRANSNDRYERERENRIKEREREERLRQERQKQRDKEERLKQERIKEIEKEKHRNSNEKKHKNRHRSRSVEKKHKDKKHKKHKSEKKRSRSRSISRSISKEKIKSKSPHKKQTVLYNRNENNVRESSFERDLRREKERQMKRRHKHNH